MSLVGNEEDRGSAYLDALARLDASETCIRCPGNRKWKTAALLYQGLEWNYYYCYECSHWFARHFRQRYLVFKVEDRGIIRALTWHIDFQYEALYWHPSASWFRRRLSAWRHLVRDLMDRLLPRRGV